MCETKEEVCFYHPRKPKQSPLYRLVERFSGPSWWLRLEKANSYQSARVSPTREQSSSILVRFTEILREVHQTPSLPGQAMGAPAVVCITLGPLRFTPALYHEQLLRDRALRVGRGLCDRRWNARGARRGWRIGGWYLQRRNTDSRSHHHRERFFKLVQVEEALKSVVLRTTRFVGAKVTRLCRKLESAEKIVSFVLGTILVTLANWKTLSPSRCETRRLSPLDQRAAQSLVDIPALRKYVHQ